MKAELGHGVSTWIDLSNKGKVGGHKSGEEELLLLLYSSLYRH